MAVIIAKVTANHWNPFDFGMPSPHADGIKEFDEFYAIEWRYGSPATKRYGRDREKRLVYFRKRSKSPEFKAKWRARFIEKKYGITTSQYNEMHRQQNGCCAICGLPESSSAHKLAIDHDHVGGKIRGLLCTKCNPMLGYANDSIEILEHAIEYLKKHKEQ